MLGFSLHWIYAHLIGDFLLSNDPISIKKKTSHFWCFVHVVLYMVPFLFTEATPLQFGLIAAQHYVQDKWMFINWLNRVTMKFQHPSMSTWGSILIDQIIHILWMAFVFRYI